MYITDTNNTDTTIQTQNRTNTDTTHTHQDRTRDKTENTKKHTQHRRMNTTDIKNT